MDPVAAIDERWPIMTTMMPSVHLAPVNKSLARPLAGSHVIYGRPLFLIICALLRGLFWVFQSPLGLLKLKSLK